VTLPGNQVLETAKGNRREPNEDAADRDEAKDQTDLFSSRIHDRN
jgi:hypothetical protein